MHMANPGTIAVAGGIWIGYSLMYTPMKRFTTHNTLFGAIVGALPPLIGTYAALGQVISPESMLLATYIFSWQWPHFYGILYENRSDYKRAGYTMLSNTDPDGKKALKHIYFSSMLSTIVPAAMWYTGMINPVFLAAYYFYFSKAMNSVSAFAKEGNEQNAKKIKVSSYMPFFLLLCGIYATTILNKTFECISKY